MEYLGLFVFGFFAAIGLVLKAAEAMSDSDGDSLPNSTTPNGIENGFTAADDPLSVAHSHLE